MKRLTTVIIIILFLSTQIPNALAEDDRIETTENDGGKQMFLTFSVNINFELSTGVSHVVSIPPPYSFPFEKIFEIISEIMKNVFNPIGVGCTLLAWKIWNLIKGLRPNRPKDYNEVNWK